MSVQINIVGVIVNSSVVTIHMGEYKNQVMIQEKLSAVIKLENWLNPSIDIL